MPGDNFIVGHWNNELQVFQQNLVSLQQKINAEAIHDLRVAVKKLRCYAKLCTILFKTTDSKKLLTNTEELFSVLGRHRNIEVCKELLPSFFKKDEPVSIQVLRYLQLLQEQVSQYCKSALDKYERTPLNELTRQIEQNFKDKEEQEIFILMLPVLKSSIKNIKQYLKDFKNRSHRIRKSLKDVFYWSKACPVELVFTKAQLKTIDKILDHLGSIQDHEVLRTNLKIFRKTILTGDIPEYDMIKKTEMKAERKKNNLLQKAHRMTEELIKQVYKK